MADLSFIDLSDNTKLRLSGADRLRYLNGQVTNDVARTSTDSAIAACVTTAKGKMNAFVFITRSAGDDAFLIDAPQEHRESLALRLEKYIIADDCELEDVTDDFDLIHVPGESAPETGQAVRNDSRFRQPGFDVWLPRGAAATQGTAISAEEINALCVRNLVPRWGAELTENTLPAEAGLDTFAVDFHKGCYIGQEVISRIKSVGRVNRLLVQLKAAEQLTAGSSLQSDEGKDAGQITSASGDLALAIVKRDYSAPGTRLTARNPEKELSTACEIIQTPHA